MFEGYREIHLGIKAKEARCKRLRPESLRILVLEH